MNIEPDVALAAREQVIALLTLLPSRLGSHWPLDRSSQPDWPAWRSAEELALTFGVGTREFNFLHSLHGARSASLIVECRFGVVPRYSAAECYRKLMARNHQNISEHPSTYALDPSTKAVLCVASYLIDSLNLDRLTDALADAALQAMSWQEEFGFAS
jgi:hypothetical protein